MKVVIIAAGQGIRLRPYTEDMPKCMLDFGGKTLLQRQIEAYNACGIENISVIRGYKKESINYAGLTYYENDEYENNNILVSLFYAEKEITGELIVGYSDILFDKSVPAVLAESTHDISIVVDVDWTPYYVNRDQHPISEAEKVRFDDDFKVTEIGKLISDKDDVDGEFIGMFKLNHRGAEIFKSYYHKAKSTHWGKPFQRAKLFQKSYLTDFFQYLNDLDVPVHCVIIKRGWKEIDTIEDYQRALADF